MTQIPTLSLTRTQADALLEAVEEHAPEVPNPGGLHIFAAHLRDIIAKDRDGLPRRRPRLLAIDPHPEILPVLAQAVVNLWSSTLRRRRRAG